MRQARIGQAVGNFLLVMVVALACAAAVHPIHAAVGPGRMLRVRIYDHASVPATVLTDALEVAQGVLREAGVETEWHVCWRAPNGRVYLPACDAHPLAADIYLKIVPQVLQLDSKIHPATMGLTLGDEKGFSRVAYLFYERVDLLVREDNRLQRERVLGLAAAHEVGHLLGAGHSGRGIMRAKWFARGLENHAAGDFQFTADDKRQMLRNLGARAEDKISDRILARAQPQLEPSRGHGAPR